MRADEAIEPVSAPPGRTAGRVFPVDLALVGLAAAAVALYDFWPWIRALEVPFEYAGDAVAKLAAVKAMVREGSFARSLLLSAPTGLEYLDLPKTDPLNFWLLRGLSMLCGYERATNLYYFLSFPLVALSSYVVLRRWVGRPAAFVGAFLYTWLPYHYARGTAHLFQSCYFLVPPAAGLVVAVLEGAPWTPAGGRRWGGRLLLAVALALQEIYAAAFFCFLLGVAALARLLGRTDGRAVLPAVALVAACGTAYVATQLPRLRYEQEHGRNRLIVRSAREVDFYSLSLANLVLPTGHSIGALRRFAARSNEALGLRVSHDDGANLLSDFYAFREQCHDWLPTLPLMGLAIALASTVPRLRARLGERATVVRLQGLAALSLAALLFAMSGGIASLVAASGFTLARAVNRIAIYAAFFSVAAFVLWLDGRMRTWRPDRRALAGFALVAFAFVDQRPPRQGERFTRTRREWLADQAFARELEARLPEGTGIFQLPVQLHPEGPVAAGTLRYDSLKLFLHSDRLRFSAGAISGRQAAYWQSGVEALREAPEALAEVRRVGFGGLLIDRWAFADEGVGGFLRSMAAAADCAPGLAAPRYLVCILGRPSEPVERLSQYTPHTVIDFRRKGNAFRYEALGWWEPEADGTWTDAEARLRLSFDRGAGSSLRLHLRALPYLGPGRASLRVDLLLANAPVATWTLDRPGFQDLSALLPARVADGEVEISLRTVAARSPRESGESGDSRRLGLKVAELIVTEEPEGAARSVRPAAP